MSQPHLSWSSLLVASNQKYTKSRSSLKVISLLSGSSFSKYVHWKIRANVMIWKLMIFWIRWLWRGFRRFRGGTVARLWGLLPICWIMITRRGWCLKICRFGLIENLMKEKILVIWRLRRVFLRIRLKLIMQSWLNQD